MKSKLNKKIEAQKAQVLIDALVLLSGYWKLDQARLGRIIGKSTATISRMLDGKTTIDPDSKSGELALYLIRVSRSLNALMGDRYSVQRQWLSTDNKAFNCSPLEALTTAQGLVEVVSYLDAMRGKI